MRDNRFTMNIDTHTELADKSAAIGAMMGTPGMADDDLRRNSVGRRSQPKDEPALTCHSKGAP